MSSRRPRLATCPVLPATDPIGLATHPVELAAMRDFAPLLRPRPSLAEAAHGLPEMARLSCPPGVVEAAGKPGASPRLYGALRSDPRDNATRILFETEALLRRYGHRKIRVADVADACGFSAANVYRYFSSRRAILDALASHYLHEAERTARACAICSGYAARDRLRGFLTGLNTALILFSDCEPQVSELLADAAAEQWPCYSRYDARIVRRIAKILTDASASGEFRLEGDSEQQARGVMAAACALLEPDVVRLRRGKHDVRTAEALSRLIATALSNRSVPPSRTSPHADRSQTLPTGEKQWL
jgi:AcrR family transcriptional regulator